MTTIEFDGKAVQVPDSWDDITVGSWESLSHTTPTTARERVTWIAKLCNVDETVLLGWPVEAFNAIVETSAFVYGEAEAEPTPSVEVDGMVYVVPMEEKLTLGAWIDAEDVQRRGEGVISGILAVVCRPVGEEYDCDNNAARGAMFARLPVSKVLGVLAFFLSYSQILERRTEAYTRVAQAVERLQRSIPDLRAYGGGTRPSRMWLAIKFWISTASLRYRWARYSRTYGTDATKVKRKRRSTRWTAL